MHVLPQLDFKSLVLNIFVHLEVEMLGYMVTIFYFLNKLSVSLAALLFYILTSNASVPVSKTSCFLCFCMFLFQTLAIFMGIIWYLIFLLVNYGGSFLICLSGICISSWEKKVSPDHFLIFNSFAFLIYKYFKIVELFVIMEVPEEISML